MDLAKLRSTRYKHYSMLNETLEDAMDHKTHCTTARCTDVQITRTCTQGSLQHKACSCLRAGNELATETAVQLPCFEE